MRSVKAYRLSDNLWTIERRTLLLGTIAVLATGHVNPVLGRTPVPQPFSAPALPLGGIPEGTVFKIDGTTEIGDKDLLIDGTLEITGSLVLRGDVKLHGKGTIDFLRSKGGIVVEKSGNYRIDGITVRGSRATAAIEIAIDENQIAELFELRGCTIEDCNYGILRQQLPGNGRVKSIVITDSLFQALQGDAIEINLATADRIQIVNNHIMSINNTEGKPFWGIGIGLAGKIYDSEFPSDTTIHNFVVRNNIIEHVRQAIHVEAGSDFEISGNTIRELDPSLSVRSGLEVGGIILYGCARFELIGNRIDAQAGTNAVVVQYGYLRRRNVASPEHFLVMDNDLANGTLLVRADGADNKLTIERNTFGLLSFRGCVASTSIKDNLVRNGQAGLQIDPRPNSGAKGLGACIVTPTENEDTLRGGN